MAVLVAGWVVFVATQLVCRWRRERRFRRLARERVERGDAFNQKKTGRLLVLPTGHPIRNPSNLLVFGDGLKGILFSNGVQSKSGSSPLRDEFVRSIVPLLPETESGRLTNAREAF